MFKCKNLCKSLNDFRLENINIELEGGEILGVIGVNGCGKTTLLRSIMGSYRLYEEDGGKLKLCGFDIKEKPAEYKNKLGFVMQDLPFSKNMTPEAAGELYGRYYKSFDGKKYHELLEKYEVPAGKEGFMKKTNRLKQKNAKYPEYREEFKSSGEFGKLSKGQQLRAQLAFALSHEVSLYVFDEPTGNLDVDFRDEFYKTMRDMVSDEKHGVIIASHIVEELEGFADKILWMYREENVGKVRFFGTIDELRDRYRVVEASSDKLIEIPERAIAGKRVSEHSKKILVDTKEYRLSDEIAEYSRMADLREIMFFIEKESRRDA